MPGPPVKSFTLTARGGLLRALVTKCGICPAFDPAASHPAHPPVYEFDAIWDTGATNTVISPSVVAKCGLKPISMAQVQTANGTCLSEVYLVNVRLPNGVGFRNVRVTNQQLMGAPVLIGMDVITQGDFVITNRGKNTVFSFRYPSMACIDFVASHPSSSPVVGRNDPCPCGSMKKYKKCCGKNA